MTTEARTGHPFSMYDHIQAGPEVFAEATRRNLGCGGPVRGTERLLATGFPRRDRHLVPRGPDRRTPREGPRGGLPVRAWHSFDFALYGPDLSPADCVVAISHRGTKQYSVESARKTRLAGCRVALVTGEGEPAAASDADAVFHTSPQERSSAHTMSFCWEPRRFSGSWPTGSGRTAGRGAGGCGDPGRDRTGRRPYGAVLRARGAGAGPGSMWTAVGSGSSGAGRAPSPRKRSCSRSRRRPTCRPRACRWRRCSTARSNASSRVTCSSSSRRADGAGQGRRTGAAPRGDRGPLRGRRRSQRRAPAGGRRGLLRRPRGPRASGCADVPGAAPTLRLPPRHRAGNRTRIVFAWTTPASPALPSWSGSRSLSEYCLRPMTFE